MRQASRLKAFPYILIAAVLAAALPLNTFAVDSIYFNPDMLTSIMTRGKIDIKNGDKNLYFGSAPRLMYGYASAGSDIAANFYVNTLYCLRSLFSDPTRLNNDACAQVSIPFFLNDISSLDLNFYYCMRGPEGTNNFYTTYVIPSAAYFLTTDGSRIDLSFLVDNNNYNYGSSPTEYPANSSLLYYFKKLNVNFSSSTYYDITNLIIEFDITKIDLVANSVFYIGLDSNSYLTSPNATTNSILKSLGIMSQLLSSIHTSDLEVDAEILNKLNDIISILANSDSSFQDDVISYFQSILAYFSSNGTGSSESDSILQEGAEKQEQLEQLGQALGDVPKPSIQDVSQLIDPNVSLSTSSPQMVQTALNIVYSWDKFLAILALVIALGTISYILFGKKS